MRFNDRIKQFGYLNTLRTLFLYALRPVFSVSSYKVLIIENHLGGREKTSVKTINENKLNYWLDKNQISLIEYNRFMNFIKSDCLGYYIEIEKELAAWGFVQTKGTYQYGTYFYELPINVHMLKNLFVKPQFRGMSLGKKINEARINGIPDSYVPCGFVIPENRFAIRNLKMLGFEEVLFISHVNWFNTFTKTRVRIIKQWECSKLLISGFQNK